MPATMNAMTMATNDDDNKETDDDDDGNGE